MNEHDIQKALNKRMGIKKIPFFAIPNGVWLKDNYKEIKKLKNEGLKSGVPDILIPVPTPNHCGLFVELKTKKGKTSKNQDKWIKYLNKAGYKCITTYGAKDLFDKIDKYLLDSVINYKYLYTTLL